MLVIAFIIFIIQNANHAQTITAMYHPTSMTCVKFCWRLWGSSLTGLCTLDPLLGPPSTLAEFFQRTCPRGGR